MKYLIVGLGNIGDEYRNTRHNIGFMVLDALAKASNIVFSDKRYGAVANMSLKGKQLLLLKPSTYMNLSGNAVRYWMNKENIQPENLLVVVDDLSLPLGKLRLRAGGSDGGHNGLKSIISNIGADFIRLYIGIGRPHEGSSVVDHVLSDFCEDEIALIDEATDRAVEALISIANGEDLLSVIQRANTFTPHST